MNNLRYTVSLLKTDEGFSVWVPGLPGCASQGETEQEALENIQDAIREYLEVADLRHRLATFVDDWDRPEMDVYDQLPPR